MHPNPVFRTASADANLHFAAGRAFGLLAVSAGQRAPLLAHVPFLLDDSGLDLHLVRSNPIARALRDGPLAATMAVSGPDSYISPDWYALADQVPTWNYVAVHLTGRLALAPAEGLRALLDRQSALFEQRLQPKAPWTSAKMSEGVMERMMKSILPCRLEIEDIDGTWKLNQNKPDDARLSAADAVAAHDMGHNTQALADMMRTPRDGQA